MANTQTPLNELMDEDFQDTIQVVEDVIQFTPPHVETTNNRDNGVLEQRVMQIVKDNDNLSLLLSQYRVVLAEQDKEHQILLDNFKLEREINQILRDCITKFSNESELDGLIRQCKDYIMYYHSPYSVTFYMHTDSLNDDDVFKPQNYSHTYSYGNPSHIETKPHELADLMNSSSQMHNPIKILSNYDMSFLSDKNTKHALICKVQYSKRILGFILIEFDESEDSIGINMLQPLIEIFSNTYSVLTLTLTLATQYGDAISKAYTDTRTGIANSRQLEFDLDSLLGKEFCLVAIDIDYFKSVNDNYGHDAGDEALTVLAKILDKYMRQLDGKGYRDGGDEFIGISLKGLDETERLVKEMLEEIKTTPIYTSDSARFFISNSVGIYRTDGKEHTEIIRKKADLLLYKSKENGKGRYTVDQSIEL